MKILIYTNAIIDALTSPITYNEDAVIEQVTRNFDIECIVTRNQKDYEPQLTKVFLPDYSPDKKRR